MIDIYDIRQVFSEMNEETKRLVLSQPEIDAAPVVHGRWIKRYEGLFDCSSCGVRMDLEGTPEEYLMHYCPNCGAKMDGGAPCEY